MPPSFRIWYIFPLLLALPGCADSHGTERDGDLVSDATNNIHWGEHCGDGVCNRDQFCCLATGSCTSDPTACHVLAPDAGTAHATCASSADCAIGEICHNSMGCLGWGVCRGASTCMGEGEVCGCDGVTYSSVCAAESAGMRVAATAPCGTVLGENHHQVCGSGGACPGGQHCCAGTGFCVRDDCAACCRINPSGRPGCDRDDDCVDDGTVCYGLGCAGPGECFPRGDVAYPQLTTDCGLNNPSCGCDGRLYLNVCAAAEAYVRIEPGDRSCM